MLKADSFVKTKDFTGKHFLIQARQRFPTRIAFLSNTPPFESHH
jgi:hypothetical protein